MGQSNIYIRYQKGNKKLEKSQQNQSGLKVAFSASVLIALRQSKKIVTLVTNSSHLDICKGWDMFE